MAEPITNVLGTVAIKHCGEYDATMHYEKLNVVTYNGSSYCAKDNTVGNLPTNTTYWDLMAEKGEQGNRGYTPVKGTDYYTTEDITELKSSLQSDVISEVSEQLGELSSATPLVASSTSGMTDTTRIYVNTTDGHWYWHNGSAWTDGGVYQATGIGDNSVNYYKLSNELQTGFYGNYEELEIDYNKDNTYYTVSSSTGVMYELTNNNWKASEIELEENEVYYITCKAFNNDIKTFVVKEGDNVYSSAPVVSTSQEFVTYSLVAKANMKLYVATRKDQINDVFVYKLIDINVNKQKVSGVLTPFAIRTGKYPIVNNRNVGDDFLYYGASDNYNTYIYRIEKGKKYNFSAKGFYQISGLMMTNLKYVITYICPRGNPAVITNDSFVASDDGFAYIAISNDGNVNGSISLAEETSKNWYAIGDSITEVNYRALHNYLYWINQDIPELNIINKGWSGTGYKHGSNTFIQRLDSINSYNLNTDIITVMGSINDIQHVSSSLGELGDTTTDTLYGSMYTFFNTLFTKFTGVRVGCISPINWKGSHSSNQLKLYVKALKETCELFNVPFLDMTLNTNLRPDNDTFLTAYYTADGVGNTGQVDEGGVHPNSAGHYLFYSRIKDFINTL